MQMFDVFPFESGLMTLGALVVLFIVWISFAEVRRAASLERWPHRARSFERVAVQRRPDF